MNNMLLKWWVQHNGYLCNSKLDSNNIFAPPCLTLRLLGIHLVEPFLARQLPLTSNLWLTYWCEIRLIHLLIKCTYFLSKPGSTFSEIRLQNYQG